LEAPSLSVANNDEVFKNLTNLKGTGSNTTYTDNGVSKIGVDHTLTADELLTGTVLIGGNIVNFASGGLTTLQTQQLYVQDLTYAQKMIQTQLPGCNFTTNQFSALVSLYSNVGSLSNGSALLNSLKNNSWAEVPTYWKSYTSGNSLAMGVSAAQRLAELGLWNK
jgi:GH24 family phage-related lysozyme (muramidase)